MMLRALRSALLVTVAGFSNVALAGDFYQADPRLATAMKNVRGTLESGLRASEQIGKPISAKFTVDQGILQLSLGVVKDGDFAEFNLYPTIGMVAEILDVADPDKLRVATAQRLAMEKATVSLRSATEEAVKANDGFRAVSVSPMIDEGDPVAVITLLGTDKIKIVTEKLN